MVRLSDIPKEELEHYELPPAHRRRRRASVGWGSCFRLEALPPTVGNLHWLILWRNYNSQHRHLVLLLSPTSMVSVQLPHWTAATY